MCRKQAGRHPSDKLIRIVELNKTFKGYAAAAEEIGGNRGCIYLCLNNGFKRKKHKGYTFEFVTSTKSPLL